MKDRSLLIVGGLVGMVIVLAAVWYLASPLFIDNTLDEAFPFEVPDAQTLAQMSGAERETLEQKFVAAVPDEETLAQLSPDQAAEVETAVEEAAEAVMTDKEMDDAMPEAEGAVVAQGQFVDADSFHQGSGSATILQQGEQRVLRFEEFSVTNGPDLHVILSENPTPTSRDDIGDNYVDLGALKGNKGNQNYEIPAGADLSQYQSIVIYCVPFHVVFSTATLSG